MSMIEGTINRIEKMARDTGAEVNVIDGLIIVNTGTYQMEERVRNAIDLGLEALDVNSDEAHNYVEIEKPEGDEPTELWVIVKRGIKAVMK